MLSCSTNNFINNSAYFGGAIFTLNYNIILTFSGINNFINNSADRRGGAIFTSNAISFNGTNNFVNNSAYWGGGAIFAGAQAVLSFAGTSNFINNSAYYDGGAIYAITNIVLSFSGINNFTDNIAFSGGAIYTESNSTLTFNGTIYFTNNGHHRGRIDTLSTGSSKGGGVYMGFRSTFSILPNTSVYWENNHANFGGAIYVYDNIPIRYCGSYSVRVTSESFTPKEECFFQLPDQNVYSAHGVYVKLVFKNNSADAAGNVLYGGVIDNCNLLGMDSYISSGKLFDMIVYIENDNKISNISSLPFHICLCTNNFPNCGSYNYPRTVYPGEIFQVPLVAVGQRYGAVPSRVVSGINNIQNLGTNLLDSQY